MHAQIIIIAGVNDNINSVRKNSYPNTILFIMNIALAGKASLQLQYLS